MPRGKTKKTDQTQPKASAAVKSRPAEKTTKRAKPPKKPRANRKKQEPIEKKVAENKKKKPQVIDAEVIGGLPENGNHGGDVVPKPQPTEGILLAHWNGRFGNRLHQYAYGAEYAKRYGIDFILPADWEGTVLFKNQKHKVLEDDELRLYINQTHADMDTLSFRAESVSKFNSRTGSKFEYVNPDDPNQNWAGNKSVYMDSVCAYHPSIFEPMDAKWQVEEVFEFSDEVKNSDVYKRAEDRQGTYDIAHLRRDDVANAEYNKSGNHPMGYSVLSRESYIKAFVNFGYDPDSIEWTSDDFSKKWHTDRQDTPRGGWNYPTGAAIIQDVFFDWFPDFLRLYFARTIFRANSSFSWWASFLAPEAKVYSPKLHKHIIYGRDAVEEVDVEFVEGNHPHWMYGNADICESYSNHRFKTKKQIEDGKMVDQAIKEVFNAS
jgi:hypothetical protein